MGLARWSALVLTAALLAGCVSIGRPAARGKVNHLVLVWLHDAGDQDTIRQVIEESQRLARIPGVLEVRTGTALPSDRPIVDSSYDVAVAMSFSSVDSLHAYLGHPDHVAMLQRLKPLIARLQVYDFQEP